MSERSEGLSEAALYHVEVQSPRDREWRQWTAEPASRETAEKIVLSIKKEYGNAEMRLVEYVPPRPLAIALAKRVCVEGHKIHVHGNGWCGAIDVAHLLDAELTRRAALDAEVVRVLEPFAAMHSVQVRDDDEDLLIRCGGSHGTAEITVGDLRAAASLLSKLKGEVPNG